MNSRVVGVLALVAVAGCASAGGRWTAVMATPEAIEALRSEPIRVTRSNGTRVTLYQAELRGDTLRGLTGVSGLLTPVSVAVGDVRAVEVLRHEPHHGVRSPVPLLVAMGGLLALGVVLLVRWWPFQPL